MAALLDGRTRTLVPAIRRSLLNRLAAGGVVLALLGAAPAAHAELTRVAADGKLACAYSGHSLATLSAFSTLARHTIDCAEVFNGLSQTWSEWEDPWFLHDTGADSDWLHWATAHGHPRQLVITQNLFPVALNGTDWLTPGAAGAYADHARTLATNLVAAGLGNSVIRLAHEANGTWYPDSIPDGAGPRAQWVAFWRQTVLAMRAVPGAHFRFDWCISASTRPVPLSAFYPGDDVVDFVGIDAYDTGVPAAADPVSRWSEVYGRAAGIAEVAAFAKAHSKPLSIPEWGVGPRSIEAGGGDDPTYVDGIATVIAHNQIAYQSYFYKYGWSTQLANGPLSLAAYRRLLAGVVPASGATKPRTVTDGSGASTPAAKGAHGKSKPKRAAARKPKRPATHKPKRAAAHKPKRPATRKPKRPATHKRHGPAAKSKCRAQPRASRKTRRRAHSARLLCRSADMRR